MTWQVTIWTHDGVTKTVDSDGSESLDELVRKAGFKSQEVNGMEVNPINQEPCNATKEGK